ncbi:MAG: right-handed parallel beta-helix repeat-containing protein [Bryobacteraceae bacterium]
MRTLTMLWLCSVILNAQTPQRRVGDWIVTSAETVENQSISLAGNLIVEGTGSLTLTNVNLTMERKATGQYGIQAKPGSSLTITRSTIAPVQADVQFDFLVDGARFTLRNNTVEGLNDLEYPFNGGGLFLKNTVDAVLEDNVINHRDTVAGIQLFRCRRTVIRNNVITTPTRNNAHALTMQ